MALIVEDGTSVTGAESYAGVAFADDYFDKRGNVTWLNADPADKEIYLRSGTDYLEQAYRMRWKGFRTYVDQALSWPRDAVMIDRGAGFLFQQPRFTVPAEVKAACCELAFRASTIVLSPDIEREIVRVKIGPLDIDYKPSAPQTTTFPQIDMFLSAYLDSSMASPMMRLGRA